MKTTDKFKSTIQSHLDSLAEKDPLFAETLKKPNKNIDECITYILNQVQKSGCNGFADEEIFGMAVHYYDEDDIKAGKSISGRVVVNHQVELTEEEIAQAKKAALDKVIVQQMDKITNKNKKIISKAAKQEEPRDSQATLF